MSRVERFNWRRGLVGAFWGTGLVTCAFALLFTFDYVARQTHPLAAFALAMLLLFSTIGALIKGFNL